MDMQAFIDAIGQAGHDARSDYHLTLGEAIRLAEEHPAASNSLVRFDCGGSPTNAHSYRGYYSDLAWEASAEDVRLVDFLTALKAALGQTFEGYKGGDFTMTEKTPMWRSPYGINSQTAIVGMQFSDDVTLITKQLSD